MRDERVINYKLAEAVKLGAEGLDIRWEGLRQTKKGHVAADLTISVGGVAVKYNVYVSNEVKLQFHSTDRSRVELAACLLRLAGVSAEVRKEGGRDVWRIDVTTDMLAAGHEKLRKALAEFIREAIARGWMDERRAMRWLEKLERGRMLMEDWPKYHVGLNKGALEVSFKSTDPDSIEQEAQRREKMGLKRGVHFTVEMPEDGKAGYVYIRKEGLAYAAWLSVNSEGEQQRMMAARFVEYILRRAEEVCGGNKECAVYKKVQEIIDKGRSWGSLEPKGFEKKVEVNGETYVVRVIGGEAVEDGRGGRKLLRIKIKVEVGYVKDGQIEDRVVREYTITFRRHGADNETRGSAYARADAPGGREADAKILAAVIEELTGVKPRIYRRKDGRIVLECGREHLDGFMRYKGLAEAIMRWLEETSRR